MSRGYEEYGDGDETPFQYLWPSIVEKAMNGKRGQAVLREIEAALLALPAKRLIYGKFGNCRGEVCALGALALKRGVTSDRLADISRGCEDGCSSWEYVEAAKSLLNITEAVAREVQHVNDGHLVYGIAHQDDTPEKRYERVLAWVRSKIKPEEVRT